MEASRLQPLIDHRLQPGIVLCGLLLVPSQQRAHEISCIRIQPLRNAFVDPLLELIPEAEVRHLGMYRDEATTRPIHYYNKLPATDAPGIGLVLDPMLATGGSAVGAIRALEQWGIGDIRMLAIIAAPEGIARLQEDCPKVRIFCCARDRELNDQKFIVPGLGDAGDRIFGT